MIELVPASPAHVGTIANRMRTIDALECRAFGRSPKQALRSGLMGSIWAITAKVDGRPEAMFGLVVTSAIDGEGVPWFLGTDEVYRHGREMIAWGPEIIGRMLRSCSRLSNHVAVENGKAIRLLQKWGFLIRSEQRDIGGIPFREFVWHAHI